MTEGHLPRRQLLKMLGTGTLVGTAGCLGTGDSTSQNSSAETGLDVGDQPPDFSLDSLDREIVSLFPVRKPTVLSFIAVSCPSCREEEVNLKPVHEQYGDQVRIMTISAEPNRDVRDDLRRFKEQYGGDWIHAIGAAQVIRDYRITSMDTTYILGIEGRLTYNDTSVTSTKTFEEQVSKLLNGGDSS